MELKKLLQTENGDILLTDQNGNLLTCPFQNAVVLPGTIQGQLTLNRPPCGSQCALFNINDSEIEGKIFLKKYCCDEPEKLLNLEKKDKKDSKLLKLQ
jgi:hypothetical protein